MNKTSSIQVLENITVHVDQSWKDVYAIVNATLTETYFHIGRLITVRSIRTNGNLIIIF